MEGQQYACASCGAVVFTEEGRYKLHRRFGKATAKELNFFEPARREAIELGPPKTQLLFYDNRDSWGLARKRNQARLATSGSTHSAGADTPFLRRR